MRVLFAHNEYGRPSGEEDAVRAIAALLEASGHEIGWFLRSSSEIRSVGDHAAAFLLGIYNPRSSDRIAAVLRNARFDVVQVQNLYPFLSPSILGACNRARVPVVMRCPNYRIFCPTGLHLSNGEICERCLGGREYWCVFRNCEKNLFKSLGYAVRNASARITRSILNGVGTFIVLSEFQKRRFAEGGIPLDRLAVLPNILPQVNGLAGNGGLGESVTFVGRCSPEKGIEDFVAAARRLPHLNFAVAGATDRVPALVASSPPNVRWCGALPEKALNELYARSRVLVFPFRWFEGFPNVITRAMALGKPVIAARIGAVPEIVEDGETGLLFETRNVDDLVSKIETLHPDARRCAEMGQAGLRKAQAQYSPAAVYARLMEIYQKAMANPA